ncbi:MAG: MATE family efflux transporter [Acidobacteria bacterium]|nr:MATE family efflux transporter [Acidobacteriota bacterium]
MGRRARPARPTSVSTRPAWPAAAGAALRALHAELPPTTRLATPIVVAELGWIAMGLVDLAMVGRLGPAAIGAVGIGSVLFLAVVVFGIGMLLGLDTLVARAYGRGRPEECRRWLVQGALLAGLLSVPLTLVAGGVAASLDRWGLEPAVERLAVPYFSIVVLSVLPLLLYTAFRRYLQATGLATQVTAALISANAINAAANWLLVFGNLGLPALGVDGAGWATCISRVYLASFLAVAILLRARRGPAGPWPRLRPERRRLRRLVALGWPAAAQVTLEFGVFAAVTALAGRLEAVTLAAHQIVLNVASVTFMVPQGVGAAGAVRVGQAAGRRDPSGVRRAGWAALALGGGFMSAAAVFFVATPHPILRLYTSDPAVMRAGVTLLLVAAFFQLFDGLQAVATGALRGLGDTRTPMVSNLAGHWIVGLPVGYVLCFGAGWGIVGLWIGLSIGLTLVGAALVLIWWRRTRPSSR